VELLANANLTLLGTAACAAAGAGHAASLAAAAAAVAQPGIVIEPDLAAHSRYAELLADYLEATALLTKLSHRLAERQLGGDDAG
jgi:ribulose kinase